MCSYNRVNGDYACENDYALNQILKHDWDSKASCFLTGQARTRPSRPRWRAWTWISPATTAT